MEDHNTATFPSKKLVLFLSTMLPLEVYSWGNIFFFKSPDVVHPSQYYCKIWHLLLCWPAIGLLLILWFHYTWKVLYRCVSSQFSAFNLGEVFYSFFGGILYSVLTHASMVVLSSSTSSYMADSFLMCAGIITLMLIINVKWKRKWKRVLLKWWNPNVLYSMMKNNEG